MDTVELTKTIAKAIYLKLEEGIIITVEERTGRL